MKKYLIPLILLITNQAFAISNDIIITGNERITNDLIKSITKLDSHDGLNAELINNSVKNLYQSGMFKDVKIARDGNNLLINVEENPVINEITFEGNKKIATEALSQEIKLAKRSILNQNSLKEDIARISDIYIHSGRFLAKINPKIVKLDQNRVNLIFEIDEGPRAVVKDIVLIGNNIFSKEDLTEILQTKEKKWYRFFSAADSYDADRLAYDKELLRRHYFSRGYPEFAVTSSLAEIDRTKQQFYLRMIISEGAKYHFGKITINNKIKKLDLTKLDGDLDSLVTGAVHNQDLINKVIDKITDHLASIGYAFVNIVPNITLNKSNHTSDIEFIINETPQVYVEKINIKGNSRTLDSVVRYQMRIKEGDPYNISQIRRSQTRIRNLNYFENITIDNKAGSADDRINLDVNVKEARTGTLDFGISYSTYDGIGGRVGVKERNFMGTGQEVGVNIERANKRMDLDISYTKPNFMGLDMDAGVDLFSATRDKRSGILYNTTQRGTVLRANYDISEYLSHLVRYSLRYDSITDVDSFADISTKSAEGTTLTSLVGHTLLYDKRDSRVDPSSGYFVRFVENLAGFGGDKHYISNELSGAYYVPIISEEYVLKFLGRFGSIVSFGKNIIYTDRFFLGGPNLRGFRIAGAGPRLIDTNESLGGNQYYAATTELKFPVGLPKELNISGSLFTDLGANWGVDDIDKSRIYSNASAIRLSYGFGFSWGSPLGPIRIDFAKPIWKQYYDNTENFRFSFGTSF